MVAQTPQPVHARDLRHAGALVHLRVRDAPEFGEEGVDDPGVVSCQNLRCEGVSVEFGEQMQRLSDVVFEAEWQGADGGGYRCGRCEVAPEVFDLREIERVDVLRFGHCERSGYEESVEGV